MREAKSVGMNKIDEYNLRMRRNRDFLWISSEKKKIYLKEQESCLILYFTVYKEMLEYIENARERICGWMMESKKQKGISNEHLA